jgi:hypothetical protein
MNNTNVFAYFSVFDASLDIKHVAKFHLKVSVENLIYDFCWPLKSKIHESSGKYIEKVKYFLPKMPFFL